MKPCSLSGEERIIPAPVVVGAKDTRKTFLVAVNYGTRPHPRLTRREQELVAEILAGRSNRAIAQKLGIKEQTVRNQLSALFRKVGVSSRLELAVKLATRDTGEL